jgi:hypothetical protein
MQYRLNLTVLFLYFNFKFSVIINLKVEAGGQNSEEFEPFHGIFGLQIKQKEKNKKIPEK